MNTHRWKYDQRHKQYWTPDGTGWRVEVTQLGWALFSDEKHSGIYPVHHFSFLRSAKECARLMDFG